MGYITEYLLRWPSLYHDTMPDIAALNRYMCTLWDEDTGRTQHDLICDHLYFKPVLVSDRLDGNPALTMHLFDLYWWEGKDYRNVAERAVGAFIRDLKRRRVNSYYYEGIQLLQRGESMDGFVICTFDTVAEDVLDVEAVPVEKDSRRLLT